MTIDEEATYRTLDAMQLSGDYTSIREIIEYATAALVNDGEVVTLDSDAQRLRKMIQNFCNGQKWADALWQSQSHIKPLFDEVQDKAPKPGVRCRHCGEEIEHEQGQFWVHRNSLSMYCALLAEPVEDYQECNCHKCREAAKRRGEYVQHMMVVCRVCGNKRCPKASDHTLKCTGSNEPGQSGSIYA